VAELTMFDSASPWDEVRLSNIKNKHNGIAVTVYVRGTPGGFRHASAADVQLALKHGLGVVPGAEWYSDAFNDADLPQMRAYAVEAKESTLALGFPDDGSVSLHMAWDYQIPLFDLKRQYDHFRVMQDVFGDTFRGNVYGQDSFIQLLGDNGWGDDRGHWLLASTWGLPNYNIGSPYVAACQAHHANGDWWPAPVAATDISTVTQPDKLGAWWPEGSEYGDMSLSPDDKQWMKDFARSIQQDDRAWMKDQIETQTRQEVRDAFKAALTGQDSGAYTHDAFPLWVREPGLRDLVAQAARQSDPDAVAAKVVAAVKALPGGGSNVDQATMEAAVRNVLKQGVGPTSV
jgi:hypothetical protein